MALTGQPLITDLIKIGTLGSASTDATLSFRTLDTTYYQGMKLQSAYLHCGNDFTAQATGSGVDIVLTKVAAASAALFTIEVATGDTGDLTGGTPYAITLDSTASAIQSTDATKYRVDFGNDDANGAGPTHLMLELNWEIVNPGA